MAGIIKKQMEEGEEEPGDPTTPDNTPEHENAESPQLEQQEGAEEDSGPEGGEGSEDGSKELDDFLFAVEGFLYDKKSNAAEKVASSVKSAKDPIAAMANTAYDIVAMVDEKTGGNLADEMLASAAAETLGMVAEVAEAAGIDVTPREIASATRIMLKRFLAESGEDPAAADEMSDDDVVAKMSGGQDQAPQPGQPPMGA